MSNTHTKKSGFIIAGLVLGIVGICTSFIPIINNLSIAMGALAIIFAFISLIKKYTRKINVVIVAIIGIITIAATIQIQEGYREAIDDFSSDIDKDAEIYKQDIQDIKDLFEKEWD